IQFRLAKDRFESDKLLIKNLINQQLFPKLQKISPAYAPLAGHYFEWDNTEQRTPEQVAQQIAILAQHFDLDMEEVSQKTGFKIIGQKQNGFAPTPPEDQEIKKKSGSGK
nr:phage head morphogenesis protein [Flavobacterium sp.]